MARDGRGSEAVVAPPIVRPKSTTREYGETLFVALLLALVIRTFVVQAFKIPSGSMLPTLQIGDHILVNKFIYGPRLEVPLTQWSLGHLPGLREPRPGDVIVFIYPRERDKDFIKRVIAVAGQTLLVRGTTVIVDGKKVEDPNAHYTKREHVDFPERTPDGKDVPYTVPPGHVFVMGDNRDESYDSRFWGPVPIEDIKGLAMVIYWSWGGEHWVRWDRLGRLVF
jgi:signal peptidase I